MISVFGLTIIIDRYGIGVIIFTVIVCIVGILIYTYKMKDQRCIDIGFKEGTISYMYLIPCFIIDLVRYTIYCCKCNYVVTTTIYEDMYGHRWEENNYCLVFVACYWNIMTILMKIIITFYTIIFYYVFLLIFSLVSVIAKANYNSCHKNEEIPSPLLFLWNK